MGLWNVCDDVGKYLFDAEVAVAEGCTIEEAIECFLSDAKVLAPVTKLVDKIHPDGKQDWNIVEQLAWGINVVGGTEQEW